MRKILSSLLFLFAFAVGADAIDLTKATIVVGKNEAPLVKKAAEMLGITRQTLYNKMKKLGV